MQTYVTLLLFLSVLVRAQIIGPTTGNIIKIGRTVGETGDEVPYSLLQDSYFDFFFNYTNTVLGGIEVGGEMYQIEQVVYNSASDCTDTGILYQRLCAVDKVDILLNTVTNGCPAGPQAAENYSIPMINGGDFSFTFNYPDGLNWTFTSVPNIFLGIRPCLLDFYNAGARSGILAVTEILYLGFVGSINATVNELFPGFNLTIYPALDQTSIDGNNTYRKYLDPIIKDWQKLEADIFIGGAGTDGTVNLVNAMRENKYNVKGQYQIAGPNYQAVRNQLGWEGYGLATATNFDKSFNFTDPFFGNTSNFVRLFEAYFQTEPDSTAAAYMLPGIIALAAIQKAGSLDPELIREALANLNITTFTGPVSFSSTGVIDNFQSYCYQISSTGEYNVIGSPNIPNNKPNITYPYVVTYPPGFFPGPNYRTRNIILIVCFCVGVPIIAVVGYIFYFIKNNHILIFSRKEVEGDGF